MTTAYHDTLITSAQVCGLMRRINALELESEIEDTLIDNGDFTTLSSAYAALCLGQDGYLYVMNADTTPSRFTTVYKYTEAGALVGTFTGLADTPPTNYNHIPGAICADADGNFYIMVTRFYTSGGISGRDGKVMKYLADGSFDSEWDVHHDDAPDDHGAAQSMCMAGDSIYVLGSYLDGADDYSFVHKYDFDGTIVSTPLNLHESDVLGPPEHIAVDADGNIYTKNTTVGATVYLYKYDSSGIELDYITSSTTFFESLTVISVGFDGKLYHFSPAGVQIRDLDMALERDKTINDTHYVSLQALAINAEGTAYILGPGYGSNFVVIRVMAHYKTEWFAYDPAPISLGTWDGGDTVPDDNALSDATDALVVAQVIEDMRDAIQALAPWFEFSGTAWNWTDADADNLYFNAVDLTDYNDSGNQYNWNRGSAAMLDDLTTMRDIGEIDDCVTLLEASDPA